MIHVDILIFTCILLSHPTSGEPTSHNVRKSQLFYYILSFGHAFNMDVIITLLNLCQLLQKH